MNKLDRAFQMLIRELANRLPPGDPEESTSVFRFRDAYELSRNPLHRGWYVMQESRCGCREPFNHWGYMLKKEMN